MKMGSPSSWHEENEMTFERSEAAYVRLVDNYDYASAELAEDSE